MCKRWANLWPLSGFNTALSTLQKKQFPSVLHYPSRLL